MTKMLWLCEACLSPAAFHTEEFPPCSRSLLFSSSAGAGNAAALEHKGLKCYSLLHCLIREATGAVVHPDLRISTVGEENHLMYKRKLLINLRSPCRVSNSPHLEKADLPF